MSVSFNFSGLSSGTSSTGLNGSGVSFQGISSGIQTNALVQAEITKASQPMKGMQSQVTADQNRSTALSTLSADMKALSAAITTMNQSGFNARTVTSSDTTNTYVTATAQGGASGTYDLQVQKTALAARLTPTLDGSGNPTNLAVSSISSTIFSGSNATFALTDTNGVTRSVTLDSSNNNIYGLADAINAAQNADPNDPTSKGLGIQATVVNTGSSTNPYQLVLTSTTTGVGTSGANLSIADATAGGAVNTLGIATAASGGTQSNQSGQNAVFTLDGIQLTRSSNTVDDAVDGVTFQLLKGGQTGNTTLTVDEDTDTAANDMNSVVTAYNQMMKDYNTAAASGGALYGDSTARSLVQQVARSLGGVPSGMDSSTVLNSAASLGISTNQDGTLSLDQAAFKKAVSTYPTAALNVFAAVGNSTNPAVSLGVLGANTVTGTLAFDITSYTVGGAVTGTVTTPDGTKYNLTGQNGVLRGTDGSELDGLYLNVTGTGSGTLSLSRGVGQATMDTIASLTTYGTGQIATAQDNITDDINRLNGQITSQQNMLDTLQKTLEARYSQMEATLAQLQAASSSLGSLA